MNKLPCRTPATHFWRQKRSLETQNGSHFFHFWQTGMVFEIVNPFSWILNAIFSGKSCLISKPFLTCLLDFRTLDFFPPAESWLVNSNFPRASRMQGSSYLVVCIRMYWYVPYVTRMSLVCYPYATRKWSRWKIKEWHGFTSGEGDNAYKNYEIKKKML